MAKRTNRTRGPGVARRKAPEIDKSLDLVRDEKEQRTHHHAVQHRGQGPESHAALTASMQSVFGNDVVSDALSGSAEGLLNDVIGGAMTLGSVGIPVAESVGDYFSNSAVQGWVAQSTAEAEAAPLAAQTVARRAAGDPEDGVWGSTAVSAVNRALGGGGKELPTDIADKMSRAMGGVDLSDVRIHTGAAAVQASEAVHAHAFTVGTDVYFNRGEFRPGTSQGQHLLAHELTHVVQFKEGRLNRGGSDGDLDVSSPSDATELEAERVARSVTGVWSQLDDAVAAVDAELDAGTGHVESGVEAAGAAIGGAQSAEKAAPAAAVESAPAVERSADDKQGDVQDGEDQVEDIGEDIEHVATSVDVPSLATEAVDAMMGSCFHEIYSELDVRATEACEKAENMIRSGSVPKNRKKEFQAQLADVAKLRQELFDALRAEAGSMEEEEEEKASDVGLNLGVGLDFSADEMLEPATNFVLSSNAPDHLQSLYVRFNRAVPKLESTSASWERTEG